jgi:hypothetical protein
MLRRQRTITNLSFTGLDLPAALVALRTAVWVAGLSAQWPMRPRARSSLGV